MFHLSLIVVEEEGESLNEVVVSDFFTERVGEGGEVLGESKSYLPGFVLTGSQEGSQSVDLVLFLGKVLGHWNERLKTHNSYCILLILRQLSENWQYLLENMLFLKLSSELTKFRSASSSNHGCIFIAKLDELLSKFLLLWARLRVAWEEQLARADSSSEPLTLGKFDHKWSEHILDLSIAKTLRNSR